ncbi:Expansin cellulose-binding-like domain superfamily [Arabidopsis thaliana x Arabidopsis arenosa]|uniref:Expansin cellulose-binding-like domain superfamily n=1 Tax=Arabidopsis thaliana x Arabidopsis arenosa TaxID=1240361 RepID=A0A8T1YE71_9BRAS|nr:Expansin cellulose-binding-like domain superfamily [Arabidopsis thaliana x Arabidopsis arenosa]
MAALTLHHSCFQASGHLSRRLYHPRFSNFPRNPVKNLIFRLSPAEFSSFSLSTRGAAAVVRALCTVATEESPEKKMVKGDLINVNCIRWSIILGFSDSVAPIRVEIDGYLLKLLMRSNVGLDGEVVGVKVKGHTTAWIPMARNWGQNWHASLDLIGQSPSFEVTLRSGKTIASYDVAPPYWRLGMTYQGKQFHS